MHSSKNSFAASQAFFSNRYCPSIWNQDHESPMQLILHQIESEIKLTMLETRTMVGTSQMHILLQSLLDAVILARNSQEYGDIVSLLQKTMEGFLNSITVIENVELLWLYRGCYLKVLMGLQDMHLYGPVWTSTKVTGYLIQHHENQQYNFELVDLLVSFRMINLKQYDMGLVQLMKDGVNSMAVKFAIDLVQYYCIDRAVESSVSVIDLIFTIEALTQIAAKPRQAPEPPFFLTKESFVFRKQLGYHHSLTKLIENLHQTDGNFGMLNQLHGDPFAMMQSSISQALRVDEPPGLHLRLQFMLTEWVNMQNFLAIDRESKLAFSAFMRQTHQLGMLQTDDLITYFFHVCTRMCVNLCFKTISEQFPSPSFRRDKCYFAMDAYAHLLALLVKHSGGITNTVTKINLLNKVLGIVAGELLRDHEVMQTSFQDLPYYVILVGLFIKLNDAEPILESINFQVLTTFCNLLHVLKPSNAPGFALAWLDFVSHRDFMGRMLVDTPEQKSWGMYAQLLIVLFEYLSPFLKNDYLELPIRMLHKCTLKVLRDMIYDFPEFLCKYRYEFCDAMSPHCIKMLNSILSAVPLEIPAPDPFTPDLKVDMLPEMRQPPHISTSFVKMIETTPFKKDLDSYLEKGSPATFLSKLIKNLKPNEQYCPFSYNVPLINALVLYVGTQAIDCINSKGLVPSMSTITDSSHTEFFNGLVHLLDSTGLQLFLTAICNQLTYPNCHTHYFSCLLQYLYNATIKEEIHEDIARVVLERMAFKGPCPWGVIVTVLELMKNPIFELLSQDYVEFDQEAQKLYKPVDKLYEEPKSNPTTDDPETTEIKPNSDPTTDDPETTEIKPNSDPTTDDPEMTEIQPKSNPTTDDPETNAIKPKSNPTTDDPLTTEIKPKSKHTTDDPEMTDIQPKSNPTTDVPETTEIKPKSKHATYDPLTTEIQPKSNPTTDDPETNAIKPKLNPTTDDPLTSEIKPKSKHTTDDPEMTDIQPKSNPTTDVPETTEIKPKSKHATDDPLTTEIKPKSKHTTDDPEMTDIQPKSNPTPDVPETTEIQPKSNPTTYDPLTTEIQPKSNPTTDVPETTEIKPKSKHTTYDPLTTEIQPKSNPTTDDPLTTEIKPKSKHITDDPEMTAIKPKSNPILQHMDQRHMRYSLNLILPHMIQR